MEKIYAKDLKYSILLFLLTFPHINPDYLAHLKGVGDFFDVWRVLSFFVIAGICFAVKKKISIIAFDIVVIEMYLVAVTAANDGDIVRCIVNAFSIISVVLLYDFGLERFKSFLSVQLFCFEIVIYINLITELLFPAGMYKGLLYSRNFFLGYYNTHIKIYIPAMLIAFLYMLKTGKKGRTILLIGAVYLSTLLVWAGGTVTSLFIILITYIFFKNKTQLFNYFTYWLVQPLFFILIIVLKMQYLFRWFIDGGLHKWKSLTDRMIVWEMAKKKILESPIFGYGMQPSAKVIRELVWASHTHNQLLEQLFVGGIVYFLGMILLIVLVGVKISRQKNTLSSMVISLAFFGWWINTLVEPYTTPFLMAMFVLAYRWIDLIANRKIKLEFQ